MKFFGLIGEKLSHSLSPVIHNMLYQLLAIDASYSLYQVKPSMLEAAVHGIRALDIRGVNVTIPYKVKTMMFLDSLAPEAQKIGAVNTVFNENSRLTGYNTDYIGFGRMLDKYQIAVSGKTAVLLGSGGAAKATAAYLEDKGISKLYIVTREPEKVTDFGGSHSLLAYHQLDLVKQADLLVNCTPVGMYPNIDTSPLCPAEISRFRTVVDLIYNPSYTLLMQQASALGIPAYNGLYMLVSQAVAAVEIWNGIEVSEEIADIVYQRLVEHINK